MSYHISLETDFKFNSYPGRFVALEGIDGSGKTSQVQPLQEYFEKRRKKVIVTKTPRRDKGILAAINKDLMNAGTIIKPAYQYLFTADYIVQMEELVIPALKRGDVVITDRYHCWSALAYGLWEVSADYDISLAQSLLVGLGLFSPGYQLIVPDTTLFFEVEVKTALQRIPKKNETKEIYEKESVLEKVVKGYEWLLTEFPQQFVRIDANGSVDEVTADMIKTMQNLEFKIQNKGTL